MSRIVVFFIYTNPARVGPVSLGFSDDDTRAMPFEANLTFVVEHRGGTRGVVGRDSVVSATFNYGELSLELGDLERMKLGFGASGGVESFNCVFRPGNTLSSTGITITGNLSEVLIRGTDRDTAENFEYRYIHAKQSASRVPAQTSSAQADNRPECL